MSKPFIPKEISWLSFNARVLQEAEDPAVPLMERLKFLGIFSSNLDEFFRVRVATLQRLVKIRKKATNLIGHDPKKVLEDVQKIVLQQSERFDKLYQDILKELASCNIYIKDDSQLTQEQMTFVRSYFQRKVRPLLVPLIFGRKSTPKVRDHQVYLAVEMKQRGGVASEFALIQIPTDNISRFLLLPCSAGEVHVILLDDVIRLSLQEIFSFFGYEEFNAYTIKLTRDSELDLDDELFKSFPQKVQESLDRRKTGAPVRFVYDRNMPEDFRALILKRLAVPEEACIPGGRYHNFKDFMDFPALPNKSLYYPGFKSIPHPEIDQQRSLLELMQKKDLLLHFPYHSFDHFVDLLREAAIDPAVSSIRLTVYRLAPGSQIVNALISAAQNGKKVFVVVELQARFDEEANLEWSNLLREDGVRVDHGVPGLKVHSKLCLITRKENRKTARYAAIGTGNFNESTARFYTDHLLLTTDKRLVNEVHKVFEFFENTYRIPIFRHLVVSPFQTRNKIRRLIRSEIKAAKEGRDAWIDIKINNLSDQETIKLLYDASAAGVRVRVIARSMFSLVPDKPDLSENIAAISIVDRFLEHTRFFSFANGGDPVYFLSSADWLPRNFDRRVEVACPVYDPALKQELRDYFEIQWRDNTKARYWNESLDNAYVPQSELDGEVRSQNALAEHIQKLDQPKDFSLTP